jgi:hypothetical protein
MVAKWTITRRRIFGSGTRFSVASVVTASVPSEPTTSLAMFGGPFSTTWFRLYPATVRHVFG